MTRKERVIQALRHEQPDWLPYQLDATQELAAKVVKETGHAQFWQEVGNHLAGISFDDFREVGPDRYADVFGVVWNRSVDKDIGIVETYQLAAGDLDTYEFPDPDAVFPSPQVIEEFLNKHQDCFCYFDIGFSMFERAWTLRGMEQLLIDMLERPAFVHELLDRILEFNLAIIERALQYDFACLRFGDDWGQQRGLIMGPKLWREFIKPRIAAMYARVKAAGKYVIQHSCGDIQELFPDLIEIGLDIFNTFQPELMDVARIKQEYGKYLSFYGGISTQKLLPFATSEEVKRKVQEMIRVIGKDGGYIVAPTHAMPRDIPTANVLAFVEAVQNQG